MKQLPFCLALILLSIVTLTQAQQSEPNVIVDVTYVGKYLDKGFDTYADHSGIESGIDIDLYGSGFGLNLTHFRANTSGFENSEKLDCTAYYYNSLFKDSPFALDYQLNWIYHLFPDQPRSVANTQEIEAVFAWPKITSTSLVPTYSVCCEWPAGSNYGSNNAGGWAHVFGLEYDLALPALTVGTVDTVDTSQRLLHLSVEAVYNDGLGGPAVDHDWSHMVVGLSTEFELVNNLVFTPGFYYQSSWDDSVNTEDEFWLSLSLSRTF